jgi:hypothetical protein
MTPIYVISNLNYNYLKQQGFNETSIYLLTFGNISIIIYKIIF